MRRLIIYLAYVWEILIGVLLITPNGVFCIACGQVVNAPGYIGQVAVKIVAVVAIVLGLAGLVTGGKAGAGAAGAAAGR